MSGNNDKAAQDALDAKAALEAERAAEAAGEQGLLFDDDVSPLPSDAGYRGPTA